MVKSGKKHCCVCVCVCECVCVCACVCVCLPDSPVHLCLRDSCAFVWLVRPVLRFVLSQGGVC